MDNNIINSFKLKDTLNPNIWINHDSEDFSTIKLDPEIRTTILKIAKDFVDSFGIDSIEIEDILFVGSLTNYNWSNYSDVDIHVVVDKSKINEDDILVDEFLNAKKIIYNESQNIKIKGYDVELYTQDINENLESSTGSYSVLFNKWLSTPTKGQYNFDKKIIINKVKEFNNKLSSIEKLDDNDVKIKKLDDLKEKIKKYRKGGLSHGGELSNENLVFKYLRRSNFMEKIIKLKNEIKDSILSVENVEF